MVRAEPEALGLARKILREKFGERYVRGKKGVSRHCGWVCVQLVLLSIGFVVPVCVCVYIQTHRCRLQVGPWACP